ncbi:hypothetical protein ACFL2T_00340 [Elusimicrobiota bacterium]
MPGICCYKLCREPNRLVKGDDAVLCLKCETGKPMHKACWEKHNAGKHEGKAGSDKWDEPDFPTPWFL